MNSCPTFWLDGYEKAPLRKRLAYFRPWIEDRSVRLVGEDATAAEYVYALASQVRSEGKVDLVFAPGASPDALRAALSDAAAVGAAFVGWSSEACRLDAASIHQAADWPFAITGEESVNSQAIFVASGSLGALRHPTIGIAMPTHAHPRAALEAIVTYAAEYPGEARFTLVANGVPSDALDELKKAISFDRGHVDLISFDENLGYGRGCNAGLAALMGQPDLEYFAVSNDDVLPGTDCLYELVRSLQELRSLGHNPGAVGPVSNEINGLQLVDIGAFTETSQMRAKANDYWKTHRSAANQALQLRGLLVLFTRACLEAVGGFDPRFGIGNFEDDDHNLRTRLAGFTLWIATGAFLFHHGSSTFKTIEVDYEANIRRNAESMMRKWSLDNLEQWVMLDEAPPGVSIYHPFDVQSAEGHLIKINGEPVDLIHQASDVEFAAWVMGQKLTQSAEGRKKLVAWLKKQKLAA